MVIKSLAWDPLSFINQDVVSSFLTSLSRRREVVLVAFVSLAIVLSTAGIYLRSWELEFKIQELKDHLHDHP